MAKLTPEQYAQTPTEHAQQVALFMWAALPDTRLKYPGIDYMFAIPNGGSRGDTEKSRAIQGGRMKAEGVKVGVPDICIPLKYQAHGNSYHAMYIEMKRPQSENKKKGAPSEEQLEWIKILQRQGYIVGIAYSYYEAKQLAEWYMKGTKL